MSRSSFDRKHVVWLTPGFAKDEQDTSCIPPMQGLALELVDHIDLTIIALHYPYEVRVYTWKGIQVYAMGGDNARGWKKIGVFRKTLKRLQLIHQDHPIDHIHSFWLSDATVIGHRFSKKQGIPFSAGLMGQDAREDNRYLKHLPLDKLKISANSTIQAELFEQNTGVGIDSVIPFGIEPISRSESTDRTIDILGVGALTELKNYRVFLDVVQELKRREIRFKARILGDGPERKSLENFIASEGLSDCVELAGLVSREEVIRQMKQSRILLHTSSYESFGYVFLEALSVGAYVVSFEVGASKDIPSDNWATVASKDEMVQKLIELLDQERPLIPEIPTMRQTAEKYLSFWG